MKQHRNIPDDYKLKSVTVSILFEYEEEITMKDPEGFIGLDYSMHELYVDSNGNCNSETKDLSV